MKKQSSNEFVARIDDEGNITVPAELATRLAGKKLHIRLSRQEISSELKENNVTDEEVDRIASVQLESREQAEKFLLSEGKLKRNAAFIRRAKGMEH